MPEFRGLESPEAKIQRKIVCQLRKEGWWVERLIGNAFQFGMPDLLAMHPKYGTRLIDVKVPGSYNYTKAQREKWPIFHTFSHGVYILTDPNQTDKLMGPPNWLDYWKKSWGDPFASLEERVDAAIVEMDGVEMPVDKRAVEKFDFSDGEKQNYDFDTWKM